MRWTAAHPWWCGLVWFGVATMLDLIGWFSSGNTGIAAFAFNLIYLAAGYLLAIANRNEARRWDATHPEPEISS